jgi:16S rRNA (cytosine967-C5)-methyltransferase
MAFDIDPKIKLTVSDTRESILVNLKKRFNNAGIRDYKSLIVDLSKNKSEIHLKPEIIIADVPCSGSGTWSRTPEQLYFFQERKIEDYSALQKRIVSNAIAQLQPGGSFVYITCSVFKKENEEVTMYIKENFHLQLKQLEVLNGYDKRADSMFVEVFEKPL